MMKSVPPSVVGVETEEGIKILMTAQIGGEGNAYGVALYKAAESGRVAPERVNHYCRRRW